MARLNVAKRDPIYTAEGAIAKHISPKLQLRRSVMACLLWENSFYESGVSIADRIASLVQQVDDTSVKLLAYEARDKMKLRHVPLLLVRELARRKGSNVANTLAHVIQRPDEITEFLAIYWKDGKCPLSAQVKKGLAKAFNKFNEYQLAKYDREGAIRLKDALFLSHAKPEDKAQEDLWKRLIDSKLAVPDTWEVGLSTGGDKREVFTRLLKERKLGSFALIRNLRNMQRANVDRNLIRAALANMKVDRILPFRFISAAEHAPDFEPQLESALYRCAESAPKLPGKTVLIVDVSGSMYGGELSKRSTMNRAKVACSLAMLVRELCEDPYIYATAGSDCDRIHQTQKVPARRGFALSDAIYNLSNPLGGGGIFLKQVMDYVGKHEDRTADRVIVITDEQDCDIDSMKSPLKSDAWGKKNYLINISVEKNGIGYDKWTHIDGWSEAVLSYITEVERDVENGSQAISM
jgi:hypothetical protein